MNLFINAPAIPIQGRIEDIALIWISRAFFKIHNRTDLQGKPPVSGIREDETGHKRRDKVDD